MTEPVNPAAPARSPLPTEPRLAELFAYLGASHADLEGSVANLSDDDGALRLAETSWSAGEIVDHLRIAEQATTRLLSRLLERGLERGLARETETSSILARPKAAPPPESVEAPAPMRPTHEARLSTALAGLRAARAELLSVAARGDGWALDTLEFPHFALGTLTFYEWLMFTARHEARHAAQIRGLRSALEGASRR